MADGCPKCGDATLARDSIDSELYCWMCGWRRVREPTEAERGGPGKRRRGPGHGRQGATNL